MLTTAAIADELARVSYRDGWTFRIYDGAHEGQHVVIRAEVEDACNPGETVVLDIHSPLPPMPDVAYFHRWMLWRLARISSHENREFYRVDGVPPYDPHELDANHDRW